MNTTQLFSNYLLITSLFLILFGYLFLILPAFADHFKFALGSMIAAVFVPFMYQLVGGYITFHYLAILLISTFVIALVFAYKKPTLLRIIGITCSIIGVGLFSYIYIQL